MLMAAPLPLDAIRQQIASAVDIMVHLGRMRDGSRRVLSISEIGGYQDGRVELLELFSYDRAQGVLRKTGKIRNRKNLEMQDIPRKKGKREDKKKRAPVHYGIYRLSIREWLLYGAAGVGLCGLCAYIFYRSAAALSDSAAFWDALSPVPA